MVAGLQAEDGIEPVNSAAVFAAVRMRKTGAELARLRRANEATKAALHRAANAYL